MLEAMVVGAAFGTVASIGPAVIVCLWFAAHRWPRLEDPNSNPAVGKLSIAEPIRVVSTGRDWGGHLVWIDQYGGVHPVEG